MKVLNVEVWQANQALPQLTKEPWPVKTAYALAKLSRRVAQEYRDLDLARQALVRKYGEDDGKGQIVIPEGSAKHREFMVEFNALLMAENDEEWSAVALPDIEGMTLSPDVLIPLESFVMMNE